MGGRILWKSDLLVLELGLELNTRVRDVSTLLDGVLLSNTGGVLEEDDTLVVLDEDTISVGLVERDKHVLLGSLVVGAEEVLECLCGLPSVVVGDLGRGVVSDVGLANTVEDPSTNGSHESSVNGSEGSSGEGPLLGRVMGQDGVGVLEVGDEDEPVVDVEVRNTVDDEHFGERPLDRPVGKTGKDSTYSNVGHDDLGSLGVSEDVGLGVVVVGSNGVTKLTGSVVDQVQGPTEELVHHHVEELEERRIFNSLSELGLSESGDVDTLDLLVLLDSGVTQLRSSSGNKDLVSGHVASSGVVLTVRDSPRVVGNKEDRVQDPSNSVVDVLAGRVTLVTTLVSNDPKTGTKETSDKGVGKVKSDLGGGEGELA